MISLEQPMRPALIDVIKNSGAGGLTALQLWSDGTEIKYSEESETVLTYSEILAYVQNPNIFVSLWNGNWILFPNYVHNKGSEDAIWFSGTTLLDGQAYYYRIIINSSNVVRSDEYPIQEQIEEDEWEFIDTYEVEAGELFNRTEDSNGNSYNFKAVKILIVFTNVINKTFQLNGYNDIGDELRLMYSSSSTAKTLYCVSGYNIIPLLGASSNSNTSVYSNFVAPASIVIKSLFNSFNYPITKLMTNATFDNKFTVTLYAIRN